MPSLPFDTRVDRLGHLTVLARRFYDVWWVYVGADTRPNIIDAMNRFPEFFRFDEHANFVSLVTHLASLFENRNDTINFESLIAEAEKDGLISDDRIADAKSALSSVSHLRPKLAILRSNLFSHRSKSLSYEAAFDKAAITPNQFRDLTSAGLTIANALLVGRGQREIFFTKTTASQTLKMLQTLKERS
ncbi:hypothetical protein [Thermomonas carbonis]|uniref:HEPN AbiU2-like domain-containing protein n=2 Tax=Thermomonas carbonis TaxID=1463158 RepID=A0A7G9SNK5_9GAMM|nr:hypothetical protein [Thermomonas carbonis]QNN69430.1 hypothetical protein H9L16_12195 [Thermomonas carbonis]